jgi:hypothetical protein
MKIDVVVKGGVVAKKSVSTLADAFKNMQTVAMKPKGPVSVRKFTAKSGERLVLKPLKVKHELPELDLRTKKAEKVEQVEQELEQEQEQEQALSVSFHKSEVR